MADTKHDKIQKAAFGLAYQVVPKDGGFQAIRLTIEEGMVIKSEAVDAADAWDQVILGLEADISKTFQ